MTVNVLYRLSKHSDRGVYVSGEKPSRPPAALVSGFRTNLSRDLTSTMIQRKAEPATLKISNDDPVAYALQQYIDTDGHFSLVR
jgi:hypothetical protein